MSNKRIVLSENRLQKLANDVAEEVMKVRINSLRNRHDWNVGPNNRDKRLFELEMAVAGAAIRSVGEPIKKRLPKDDE
jgi:hypothetical protein